MAEDFAVGACGAEKTGKSNGSVGGYKDYFAEGQKILDEKLKKNSIFNFVQPQQTASTAIQG